MRLRPFRQALAWVLLALTPACQEEGQAPRVQLVTTACAGVPPLENVTWLLLRVTGEGLREPIERVTLVDVRPEDVPPVPPGPGRVLEVRGYTGEPFFSGQVVSVGRSALFEMPAEGGPAEPVRVILRRVETWVPVEDAQRPGECLRLTEPRAGHTATLLKDGRVLLAGGFRVDGSGNTETLASLEVLDPGARTLSFLPDTGGGAARRAFHTATLMPGGGVLLAGGEVSSAGVTAPLRTAGVWEPSTQGFQGFELAWARSRHGAASDSGGRVLLAGGVGEAGALVPEPEGVEPQALRGFPVPQPLPRLGASVSAVQEGQRVAVIGGSDGNALAAEVLTFAFDGATFVPASTGARLRQPRRNAAVASFAGQRLLVVGGYGLAEAPEINGDALPASEVIDWSTPVPRVSEGPSLVARGDVCAEALSGGRVFVAGGRRQEPVGFKLVSSGLVEQVVPTVSETSAVLGQTPLASARYLHTCTALPDGSVLVTGGLDDSQGSPVINESALLFVPVPRD
ncbi:kelch repeat-containing protein [Stigmatella sp. ncwal1]|uniref:Kelch repeat-containing protein n=1 Tax=Stigmatella ashevillensis TaxID=2995309 RepID=A0ABT5D6E4_9BACT|nr:kelch repeat-containing protein [Stigmatella ashevillena]MDC0709222.1 kelch repeat-containing protein [Stigmatella ashevillena]